MLVGEIVRVFARRGWPTVAFRADGDRQLVRFLTRGHPTLYSLTVTLDRRTGTSLLADLTVGSKATLAVQAEVRNRVSDPDDALAMYKTDFANLLRMPVFGGIRLNHEQNSVFATTSTFVDLDSWLGKGEAGVSALARMLDDTTDRLSEKLEPFKRPSAG
jgi:hypothetical protein